MQLQVFFAKFGSEDVLYFLSATDGMSYALFQIILLFWLDNGHASSLCSKSSMMCQSNSICCT